jgi:hypothetical protein
MELRKEGQSSDEHIVGGLNCPVWRNQLPLNEAIASVGVTFIRLAGCANTE